MSSQRRQIMQPWPLCIMKLSKNKRDPRSALPNRYSKVPLSSGTSSTSGTSSNLVLDCASNSTLVTNASPFNSQVTLIKDKKGATTPSHYYAENLRNNHQRLHELNGNSRISKSKYDDQDYQQIHPLLEGQGLNCHHNPDIEILMESQEVKRKPEIIICDATTKRRGWKRHFSWVNTGYLYQVLAAISVSLASMVIGFSCSYTSPALISMTNNATTAFEVTPQKASWIGSILPLSALVGGVAGGALIEYFGRRNTILATAFPFIASGLFIALASNVAMVLVGRAFGGFSVGVASLALPVYLGETIQPEIRGTLGLLPTALGNTGILTCFIAGMYMNWVYLALLLACLSLPFMILMFLIPETPRWYIAKGKTKQARKALEWLRSKDTDISDELTAIEQAHIESERSATAEGSAFLELFRGGNMKPVLISLGLMLFQQMSGINAVIFYTVTIFKDAGSTIDGNICTIIVGIVNFIATFLATAVIDRLGRKILLYTSSIAMSSTLAVLGCFFYLKKNGTDVSDFGWVPLASFVIYVIGFSVGFGPIPWLMMGEILPAKIRGTAASVVTAFNWSCTFLVTKTFNDIMFLIGSDGTFWLFGVICFLGLIFVRLCVPETRGRSLEEIERGLTGVPVRRMSAVANMKPVPTGF